MSVLKYRVGNAGLLCADTREALTHIPDASIQSILCSPPYFHARVYKGDEQMQVWGGSQTCVHVWSTQQFQRRSNDNGKTPKQLTNQGANSRDVPVPYSLCTNEGCGAILCSLGLEPYVELYISNLVQIFRDARRVLHPTGLLFIVIGDSFTTHASGGKNHAHNFRLPQVAQENGIDKPKPISNLPEKNKYGVPERLALALQADGWIWRATMPWVKSSMPEPPYDRPTRSLEHVLMLSKSTHSYWDHEAVAQPRALTTQRDKRQSTPRVPDFDLAAERFGGGTSAERKLARNAVGGTNPTRLFRDGDLAMSSLDEYISTVEDELAQLKEVRAGNGVLQDPDDGPPFLIRANHSGGPYEYCHLCDTLYQGAQRKTIQDKVCPTCKSSAGWVAHYGVYPARLITPLIKASTKPEDIVLDLFLGSGTTSLVSFDLGRCSLGIDCSLEYIKLAHARLRAQLAQATQEGSTS